MGLHHTLTSTQTNPSTASTTASFGIAVNLGGTLYAEKTDLPGVVIVDTPIDTLTSVSATSIVNGDKFGGAGAFEIAFTLPASASLPSSLATAFI